MIGLFLSKNATMSSSAEALLYTAVVRSPKVARERPSFRVFFSYQIPAMITGNRYKICESLGKSSDALCILENTSYIIPVSMAMEVPQPSYSFYDGGPPSLRRAELARLHSALIQLLFVK